MSIFRIQKDKDNPYVMLNKGFLNNPDLSAKAKGVLAYLLCLPDDWQIYENELVKHFKDGRDGIRAGIKELINAGYIERVRKRNENGTLSSYEYSVYETPNHSGKSNIGYSNIEKTNIGKSPATNKKKTNNKKTNNNSTKGGRFNNFEQRDTDYDELERKLLGWDKTNNEEN